jgi:ribosome maturation protein Sdo1
VAKKLAENGALPPGADGNRWLHEQLPGEIETILRRHKVRSGYAVLAGVSRMVWALPQAELKLSNGKAAKSQVVEVAERL